MDISKIIIPAAGLGTRFLPCTKTIPKEMLPILNKPVIQYLVEEALQSEMSNFFIVTNNGKSSIGDHFDFSPTLNSILKEKDRTGSLDSTDKIARQSQFTYIRQAEQLGLGHAISLARHSINKEYFGIASPNDIIINKQPALSQLIRVARQEKATVIAVQEIPTEYVSSHSIVAIKKQITPNLFQLSHIVDNPSAKDAPSTLAIVGRYVISHKIFNALEQVGTYGDEEIHFSDAISYMMQQNERVFAYKIQGTRFDISSPLGWVKAVISFALQDPHYSPYIRKYLSEISSSDSFLYNPAKITEHML